MDRSKRWLAVLLAVSLTGVALGGCSTDQGAEPAPSQNVASMELGPIDDDQTIPSAQQALAHEDFDYVTDGINLSAFEQLGITRPSDAVTTSLEGYYITGTSDPAMPLLLDGAEVEKRGSAGSFGVYVDLQPGDNTFTFTQGEETRTVQIKQDSSYSNAATTKEISNTYPEYDVAVQSGRPVTLYCDAPSGASVTAKIGDEKIELTQERATAVKGVPATFSAEWTPAQTEETVLLGEVSYVLNYGNTTKTYSSTGKLYLAGSAPLVVQVKDTSATVFTEDDNGSDFFATAKEGGVDTVVAIGEGHTGGNGWTDMYQLSMGGWVAKKTVTPLIGDVVVQNMVSEVSFEMEDRGERITLKGTANPMFTAEQQGAGLTISFANTTGIETVPLDGSKLFSGVTITEENGFTTLQFEPQDSATLWGYVVEYNAGETSLYCKYSPVLGSEDAPLKGVVVAVDAGHGGTDIGTAGIANPTGVTEKDVTIATATALEKRLQTLGATVLMLRDAESNPTINERMRSAQEAKADFFISLHCNSISYNMDGTSAGGVEIYYYEPGAQFLADSLLQKISENTGRYARGAKISNYKVTLNSYAPSVLIEMGFLTNPKEYDSMCSKEGIFQMVNAISDSILEQLGDSPAQQEVASSAPQDKE